MAYIRSNNCNLDLKKVVRLDFYEFWTEWFLHDGYPMWSFWPHIRTWWNVRNHEKVLLLHYLNLKKDLPGCIYEIPKLLDIPINQACDNDIIDHCSF